MFTHAILRNPITHSPYTGLCSIVSCPTHLCLPLRLCLVTPSPVHQIPTEVCPLVSLLLFHPERQGVAELLLDRFLELQNPKTSSERVQLREVVKGRDAWGEGDNEA